MTRRITVIFPRLGPYHIARLCAAADRFDVTAIELSATDKLHDWEPHAGELPFRKVTLFEANTPQSEHAQVRALLDVLDDVDSDAVAINGWSEPTSLAALEWCLDHHVPPILMSESSAGDAARTWWKELVKRRIVRQFASAIVGGRSHARYLRALGMSESRIALGYDAVDNEYFGRGADLARANATHWRQELGLPTKYLLASARFVARKNLDALIRAFAMVRGQSVDDWHLCILGDGEMQEELVSLRHQLGLDSYVHLPGFVQYDELPVYYGLASAFVHSSTSEQWGLVVNEAMACGLPVVVSERCGCVRELVREGINGHLFCPQNVQELASVLSGLVNREAEMASMGAQSREIVAAWGPQRFAGGLDLAYRQATVDLRQLRSWDRLFFRHVRRLRANFSWFSGAVT